MAGEIDVRRVVPARANWGRWTVDCATSWCTNAWMPQLGDSMWRCEVCGLATEIAWPPDPIAIEAVLLMRPDPNTRNWQPPETLEQLVMENAAHGIFPPGIELTAATADGTAATRILEAVDGRVVGGLVYGPVEQWRAIRTSDPSITPPGAPRAYREIGA